MYENNEQLTLFDDSRTIGHPIEQHDTPVPKGDPTISGPISEPTFQRIDPVPQRSLKAQIDPSVVLQIKLYQDSTKAQQYRARLTAKGAAEPHCDHYCNSMDEAVQWAKDDGEQQLLKKLDLNHFRSTPSEITLRTVSLLMREAPEAKISCDYLQDNQELLEALSKVPLTKLTVDICGAAIIKTCANEADRHKAVIMLNPLLGYCHVRGLLPSPIRLVYNTRKEDRYLRALRNGLVPRVLPLDMCQKLYHMCKDGLRDDPYFLAVLLQQTMGLSSAEVAALQCRDLVDCNNKNWETLPSSPWRAPEESEGWHIKIRKVFKRIPSETGESTKCILVVPSNIYKIRLLCVPRPLQNVLKEYLRLYVGDTAVNNTPLIPAKRGGGGATLDAIRHYTKDVLRTCGIERLYRNVFLPTSDPLQDDWYETLIPNLTIFQSTLEDAMLNYCGFERYEARYYLGRSPVSVLDDHYWESKTKLGQEKMRCKLDRWGLWGKAQPSCLPTHYEWCDMIQETVIPVSEGQTLMVTAEISGAPGAALVAGIKVPHGFSCHYVVTHSEPKPL